MKTLALFILTAAVASTASGQTSPRFAITKSTIADNGSAKATGTTRFALTGTVGQAAAASPLTSANGRFNLQPGYWGQVTLVQTPEAPELTMRPTRFPGQSILAWPVSVTGYELQESPSMEAGSWTTVPIRVIDTETEHTVLFPLTAQRQFFRLWPMAR